MDKNLHENKSNNALSHLPNELNISYIDIIIFQ